MRYTYWLAIKSLEAANTALEHAIAEGDVSLAERPKIEKYRVSGPEGGYLTRYRITLEG